MNPAIMTGSRLSGERALRLNLLSVAELIGQSWNKPEECFAGAEREKAKLSALPCGTPGKRFESFSATWANKADTLIAIVNSTRKTGIAATLS